MRKRSSDARANSKLANMIVDRVWRILAIFQLLVLQGLNVCTVPKDWRRRAQQGSTLLPKVSSLLEKWTDPHTLSETGKKLRRATLNARIKRKQQ